MKYNIGIDIGITSIGGAVVEIDEDGQPFRVELPFVHLFDAGENPKDGKSLALPRREKRGQRRVIHRRSARKRAVFALLKKHGLEQVETIHLPQPETGKGNPPMTVWDYRKEGLQRRLSDAEFARVLFHIAKRRGFQSNRKGAEPNDTEGQKALSGAVKLKNAMFMMNAPTIGAHLATLPKKRNGDGNYDNFVTRDLLRDEVSALFAAQRKFGNPKATELLKNAFEATAFFQRPLQSSENMIENCSLEKQEKRAPKFSYTAELFVLWSKLHNARIREAGKEDRLLTQDEKQMLANLAHKKAVSYKDARKALELTDAQRFNISYLKIKESDTAWEKVREQTEKKDFLKLPGYYELRKALSTGSELDWHNWLNENRPLMDDVARILSFNEDSVEIREKLQAIGIAAPQMEKLLKITTFSKTINLSLKAIDKILPDMQQGMPYDKAEAKHYPHSRGNKQFCDKLPEFEDIRNPVVKRALSQARKVINAVVRKYGKPQNIKVELAREFTHDFDERKKRDKEREKNEYSRLEARQHAAEILGTLVDNISGSDTLKYRLWQEQQGICPYSGDYITPEKLRDSLATQIDHIIPYSLCWDDSYANKVLCLADENQRKGNQIPFDYCKGEKWARLEAFAAKLSHKKSERLLMKQFDEEKSKKWKERALNDTRYMARELKNHLQKHWILREDGTVNALNGNLTHRLRHVWGVGEKNRENDLHHAEDAIIQACTSQSMVQRLAEWSKYEAKRKNPAQKPRPPLPWDTFSKDVQEAVGRIFVSRMPVRKVTGSAHQETIRSIRTDKEGGRFTVQRVKLLNLTPDKLEQMVDKERNIRLYQLLKERFERLGNDQKKAFAETVLMPAGDGKQGPPVHSIRIVTDHKSGVEINHGLASNGDMVRVDVFCKKGKYFLVPVYVHQFTGKQLPDRAIVAAKPEEEWEKMEEADFIFSLYKNDLVRVKSKKEDFYAYYIGVDRSTGNATLKAHDNNPAFGKDGNTRTGVKTLLAFEKYTVDYFGNKRRILKEKRLGVAHGKHPESGKAEPEKSAALPGE